MEPLMMRRRFAAARVASFATVGPSGHPHIVPVCFALDGDRLVTVIDHKPKSTTELRRVTNVRANPSVSLLVDQYAEDWEQLWWVRADGRASLVSRDNPSFEEVIAPLHEKYRGQYGLHGLPGPALVVDLDHWVGWSAR